MEHTQAEIDLFQHWVKMWLNGEMDSDAIFEYCMNNGFTQAELWATGDALLIEENEGRLPPMAWGKGDSVQPCGECGKPIRTANYNSEDWVHVNTSDNSHNARPIHIADAAALDTLFNIEPVIEAQPSGSWDNTPWDGEHQAYKYKLIGDALKHAEDSK